MHTYVYKTEEEVLEAACHIMEARCMNRDLVDSPQLAVNLLSSRLRHQEREIFTVLFLDSQNRLIALEDLFKGTIDGASVFPREVVKAALKYNAAALILGHNHPSGVAEPSQADRRITDRIKVVMDMVDIRVLDHIVIGLTEHTSFAERGLL
jgi:DNA repair protein RadC